MELFSTISYQTSVTGTLLNGYLVQDNSPVVTYALSNNSGNYTFSGKLSTTGIRAMVFSISSIYALFNTVVVKFLIRLNGRFPFCNNIVL